MSITWWPSSTAKGILTPAIVLMRYDWPDGQRIYQIGFYDPFQLLSKWTDGKGGYLQTPDYFTIASGITEFIVIPPDREYTYNPRKLETPKPEATE